jgi:dsRNA-specific ribonuclease
MVRAIIGAAYVDGGSQKAASCAAAIIPAIKTWHATALTDGSFERLRPSSLSSRYSIFRETELLLGYNFKDRGLLVEALTHPSCCAFGQLKTNAYKRLSFLGDAVLEIVVTQYLLMSLNRTIEVSRLQSLRVAVTNHLFLTFLCLEFHVEVDPSTGDVSQPILSQTGYTQDEIYLWTYLQSHSQELATTLSKFRSASRRHCWRIQLDFLRNKRYPWTELAALDGNNVLSDIVKSMFGAVFVDSKANLQNCQLLAARMGILTRAEQFLRYDTITDHPHIRLQKLCPKAHITYQNYKSTSTEHHFCCAAWINGVKRIDLQGFSNRMIANISVSQALARLLEDHGLEGN